MDRSPWFGSISSDNRLMETCFHYQPVLSFCNWITSTENCLHIGWFDVLVIPTLLTAISIFIITFIVSPQVDIDGILEPIFGSLLYGNNIISGAIIPNFAVIGLHLYPIIGSKFYK
ncbi:putative photosystem II [Dioscorea sansibarensis]